MINKLTKTALDQKIVEALGSELKTAASITLEGKAYKAKDLQQQFQAEVDAAKATRTAKDAYAQTVLAETKVAAQAKLLRNALRAYLIATYGAKSAIVAAFGFTATRKTVDVATKAAAIDKRKATRAAGGKKASRQPQGTKGATPAAPNAALEGVAVSAPIAPVVNGVAPKTAVAN